MIEELNLDIHHKILILLYIVVYFAAMLIQIKDPKSEVHWLDWILALLTSFVGGVVTYFAVMKWANLGLRMATTLFVCLVSYRTIKFIVSDEAQNDFAKGFWAGIKTIMQRLFNTNPTHHDDKPNNNNNGRS